MAMQVLGQSGGSSLFPGNTNLGMALPNDMYAFSELSKAELAAPQLIMLANVALTGEVNGNCCDYMVGEERQMAELTTVGNANFSDSDGEGIDEAQGMENNHRGLEEMNLGSLEAPEVRNVEMAEVTEPPVPHSCSQDKGYPLEVPDAPESADDKCKSLKNKPFRCKPCQYEAESEKEFVHHIRVHSAKRFIVEEKAEKHGQVKETASSPTDEVDFSKGPIRCDRCGYNTNRYDHYLAHLKHHNKAGENERVYKCTICTYTTVSEYHWKKHLRNHFPRKVYTCSQCSYFSDRKNNYVQHIRTHTGERPYRCSMCPYSSSQKTHLTRHMRTHSGEKPFKCEQCSYVASNQHEVTRHARQVHDGPKPLACPHCDYKTADRSNFKKHVELHVSPRQFLCPVCEYAASKKCNLQYHIKSRHPDCCDITMDVSKVRLRTKKNEVNTSENMGGDNKNAEQEQAKEELAEKKSERTVKEESLPKEKKPASSLGIGHVKTRSRRTVAESKEANVKTEKTTEKSGKTKKAKRKADASPVPLTKDFAADTDVIVKKKKKTEKMSPKCQDSQKSEGKLEVTKKPNSCLKKNKKKKYLKSKPGRNSRKLDCEKVTDEEPVSEESFPIQEEENKATDNACSELQQPVTLDVRESQCVPVENMQDQEPLAAQHKTTDMELEVKDQEMPMAEEETIKAVSQNEIELSVIPGTSSEDSNATLGKETGVLKNDLSQNMQTTQSCEMEIVTDPDPVQETEQIQKGAIETVSNLHPEDASSTKELQAEDSAEGPPPQLPEKVEKGTKADLVSASSSGTVVNENQEMEEDEGIHSHEGSDISDNISEGSDDSGLNGARTAQEKNQKPSQEVADAKATKENYVCIFCDRSFKKEGEYSKHLNRHLVNVYYLEKATKGQD